ncbi:MAG: histidinol-phosphatase HisJ family protein [Lachnospiraceae bacterium]|nr:histidinol-phosphatase HisJ family protein [Lachnospiraceae bacterium]
MAITADFHLHSCHSGDSDAPMEAMVQSAIAKGLTHMCFTEHMDFAFPVTPETPAGIFEVNTDSYLYDLLKYKEKYASQISISFGIELGLQASIARQLAVYAKSYDFDFIIGSSHIVNGKDPYYPAYYEGRSEEEAYREYFQSIIDNIKKISNYDVYGHLDYVVRYGPTKDKNYSYEKYKDLFDEILTLLLEKEKGIEINTSPLRKGMSQPNPCIDVLKRYRQLGGEIITVGSDAHTPEDVASDFKLAADFLTECGFKYYTIFQHRMPEFKKI